MRGLVFLAVLLASQQVLASEADRVAEGKALAFDRGKGNCLACHSIEDGELPGTLGPPLLAMKLRFPDKPAGSPTILIISWPVSWVIRM